MNQTIAREHQDYFLTFTLPLHTTLNHKHNFLRMHRRYYTTLQQPFKLAPPTNPSEETETEDVDRHGVTRPEYKRIQTVKEHIKFQCKTLDAMEMSTEATRNGSKCPQLQPFQTPRHTLPSHLYSASLLLGLPSTFRKGTKGNKVQNRRLWDRTENSLVRV